MRALALTLTLLGCTPDAGTPLTTDTSAPPSDPDTEATPDPDPPPPAEVRFVVLGDAGEGNDNQYAVADVLEEVCARTDRGCEFALYLGDNIYPSGASSSEDPEFQRVFEAPYANLDLPFYVVLGNHDLGGGGLGLDVDVSKGDYQVEYSLYSDKWEMPARYYALDPEEVTHGVAALFALNTTDIFFGVDDVQRSWLDASLAASSAPWRIGFGHHPYLSNGSHGNAGEYEGLSPSLPFSEIPRGQYVKDFFDASVCGKLDLYISGHDHNRQWIYAPPHCDTDFIVSGAGAKTKGFRLATDNDVAWQDADESGFFWLHIQGDELTGYAYDADGDEHGPFTVTR